MSGSSIYGLILKYLLLISIVNVLQSLLKTQPSMVIRSQDGVNKASRQQPYIPQKKSYPSNKDDEIDDVVTVKRTDSWKVLMKKLNTAKAEPEKFGKSQQVLEKTSTPKNDVAKVDELGCKHFGQCGGCVVRGEFTNTLVMRRARQFFSEQVQLPSPFQIHIGNATHWRTHAKIAVQPMSKWGGLKFGLYKANTHEVLSIEDCKVHHPIINEAMEELRLAALDAGVKGYVEATASKAPQGELRYLQMTLDRRTKKIQLVLVWNAKDIRTSEQSLLRLTKLLRTRRPDLWHSITINFNTRTNNNIFDYDKKQWKLMFGPEFMKEKVGDAIFLFKPQIFRQANLDAFENGIIPLVVEYVNNFPLTKVKQASEDPTLVVSELYSGIGLLGLNIASRFQPRDGVDIEVFCSDSNEFVDAVFEDGVKSLPEEIQEKVFFECLGADEAVEAGQLSLAHILVVDPPRRGLNEGVLSLLLDEHQMASAPNLERLIYVSCGFDALEKDTMALLNSGKWRVKAAKGFVLFPGSDHIETVVIFDRVRSRHS